MLTVENFHRKKTVNTNSKGVICTGFKTSVNKEEYRYIGKTDNIK